MKRGALVFISMAITLVLISGVFAIRLPGVGGDSGSWGGILNNFLNVSFNNQTGELKIGIIKGSNIDNSTRINITNLTAGHIGIGVTNPGAKLEIKQTIDVNETSLGSLYGTINNVTADLPNLSNPIVYGSYTEVNIPSTNSENISDAAIVGEGVYAEHYGHGQIYDVEGLDIQASSYGNGLIMRLIGSIIQVMANGNNSITQVIGLSLDVGAYPTAGGDIVIRNVTGIEVVPVLTILGAGHISVDNIFGVKIDPVDPYGFNSGNATNIYGVYIGNLGEAANITNNSYGVYQINSSDKNYFAGKIGINTTNPQNLLNVKGDINATGNYIQAGNTGITGNYSSGTCWFGINGGIITSTNCTAL